ncbi:MAG: formylglycine-generating enzyme family protein [Rhizobiaceae bacterium]
MTQKIDPKQSIKPCCTPSRAKDTGVKVELPVAVDQTQYTCRSVEIPGGNSFFGTNGPQIPDDGESPLRRKKLKPFRMGTTTVTNQEFSDFVEETGYITEAELFGWSFVFSSNVSASISETQGVEGVEWWRKVDGANWKEVNGPETHNDAWFADIPVVHISWNDAKAYAQWVGGRLPTEAEWEHAARGGQVDVRFPWGNDEPDDKEFFPCNIWQGNFPRSNSALDGWMTTAPARSFEPNAYGLFNLVGNVWEWTADPYRVDSLKKHVRHRLAAMRGFKVLKGGSFLCHRSYCYRYRIAARTGNSPDSTTTHQGFRVVWDV